MRYLNHHRSEPPPSSTPAAMLPEPKVARQLPNNCATGRIGLQVSRCEASKRKSQLRGRGTMMKNLTMAAILIGVALVGVGTARADGLDCNGRLRCKACSVVVPNVFRDTITVADTWTRPTCAALAAAEGAADSQLVCITANGFSFGAAAPVPSTPPPPTNNSCGW